jgi:hypothetical protein
MKNFKAKMLGVSLFVLTISACNHDFGKVVPDSPAPPPGQEFKKPKVLYIIADGARGTQVRDADIPTLKSLIPNAIYTWTSLADVTQTDATNWADMITGVKKEKHNVLTEDFAGNNLSTYKTIFERIKSIKADMRIASFASSAAFKTYLTGGTNKSEILANDEAVKTSMVDYLKTDQADFVVGEFSGIEKAGLAGGFNNATNPAYKTAINTFDGQVGAILASIKSRATYNSENWLIIVSSNRGGPYTLSVAEDDKTVFSNTNANTFTIIQNAGYNPTFIAKPFVGNSYVGQAVEFFGNPKKGVARVSAELSPNFNFGDTSGFTISVKIKKHKNPYNVSRGDYYYNWPSFMGKKGASITDANPATGWGGGSGNRGWDFCVLQNRWRFFISGDKDFVSGAFKEGKEVTGAEFSGDTWHDLTAVVERRVDGVKQVRLYTDGIPGITNQISGASNANPATVPYVLPGSPNFDNNSVLRLGWVPGEMDGGDNTYTFGAIDVELKEFKIFKAALSDAAVRQYACDQSIDRSHPYYQYLIGYWPIDEGTGTVLKDKGPYAADMALTQSQTDGFKWRSFTDLVCSPNASNLSLLVPKNSDIPTQILSWFNIARQASWALDGKVWIAN